tara:strand:+ start:135 stop:383 length:249 start_codon:yes stop_codon:yes gene_type:complete
LIGDANNNQYQSTMRVENFEMFYLPFGILNDLVWLAKTLLSWQASCMHNSIKATLLKILFEITSGFHCSTRNGATCLMLHYD